MNIAPFLARCAAFGLLLLVADEPRKLDFGTLASFEYKPGMTLPKEVTDLDGKEVVVPGFMRGDKGATENLEWFMLVNEACGCNGDPKLNEIVFCDMPEGQKVNAFASTVLVTGKLEVGEEKEDDFVVSLYRLVVTKVEKH